MPTIFAMKKFQFLLQDKKGKIEKNQNKLSKITIKNLQ